MNVTPIKNKVRVHTGISKELYQKITKMSKETGITKETIINTALSRGLNKRRSK